MHQKHTVYVVKEQVIRTSTGHEPMSYDRALEYGDIEFITMNDMPLYGRSNMQSAWNKDVQEFVEKYDELNDFIVTTGQPIAMFCVGWALGRAGKTPRFLMWRREENRYKVLNFDPAMPVEVTI